MQTHVVHQQKRSIPWATLILAALLVAAMALGVQSVLRDRGTTVTPSVTSVDQGASLQKTGMTEVGVTSVRGGPNEATRRDPALKATITRIEQAR